MKNIDDMLGAEVYEFPEEENVSFEEDDASSDDDESELQSRISRMIERAIQHYDETLEEDHVKATEYYRGEEFGDEVDGRSKIVSTDLRDAVLAAEPSMLRILVGGENVVEYRPRMAGKEAVAAQATDYVNYVVREDNNGFQLYHSLVKDSWIRRQGIAKWYPEVTPREEVESYSGLTEMELQALVADPDVGEDGVEITDLMELPEGSIYSATVTRRTSEVIPRVEAVPPEEFVTTPGARGDLDRVPLVAHVREVPASDLIAMGIDKEIVDDAKMRHRREARVAGSDLADARQRDGTTTLSTFASEHDLDESMLPVLFAEAYALVDVDGDGIAERRMFWCVGPNHKIVNGEGERVDMVPFALFPYDPEPHTLDALGAFDLLRDVQRVKSTLQRRMLDSLALSLDQKTEVVDNQVNVLDLKNPHLGAFIRVKKPGMMREIKHTFLGPDILPVIAHWNEIKEERTGHSKAALGLDADSLQSATKAAVAGTLAASQQRIELHVRIFAEIGLKRLYKGLLKLITRHQNRPRVIRLRGHYVEVDPRAWDADMDVQVNVALGAGSSEDRIQFLGMLLEKMEGMMQVNSPLVSWKEYRAALAELITLSGRKNVDTFLRPFGEQEEMQAQQQAKQAPPPVEMQLVQVEQAKVQAQVQQKMAELDFEREKWLVEVQMEQQRMANDFALKEKELELKYQAEVTRDLQATAAAEDAAVESAINIALQTAKMEQEQQAAQQARGGEE